MYTMGSTGGLQDTRCSPCPKTWWYVKHWVQPMHLVLALGATCTASPRTDACCMHCTEHRGPPQGACAIGTLLNLQLPCRAGQWGATWSVHPVPASCVTCPGDRTRMDPLQSAHDSGSCPCATRASPWGRHGVHDVCCVKDGSDIAGITGVQSMDCTWCPVLLPCAACNAGSSTCAIGSVNPAGGGACTWGWSVQYAGRTWCLSALLGGQSWPFPHTSSGTLTWPMRSDEF